MQSFFPCSFPALIFCLTLEDCATSPRAGKPWGFSSPLCPTPGSYGWGWAGSVWIQWKGFLETEKALSHQDLMSIQSICQCGPRTITLCLSFPLFLHGGWALTTCQASEGALGDRRPTWLQARPRPPQQVPALQLWRLVPTLALLPVSVWSWADTFSPWSLSPLSVKMELIIITSTFQGCCKD